MTEGKDRELRAKRIKRLNPEGWASLSKEERNAMIDSYDEALNNQPVSEMITWAGERAGSISLLLLGVLLGMFGGMVGQTLGSYLEHYGAIYQIGIFALFVAVLLFFVTLPEKTWHNELKQLKFFDALLENAKGRLAKEEEVLPEEAAKT